MKRSPIKRRQPKVDARERARRASARDQACTLRIPWVCNGRTDTTVYCHSNLLAHGKGMGLKAAIGAYGCCDCHDVLDGRVARPAWLTYDELQSIFARAWEETRVLLDQKGLL